MTPLEFDAKLASYQTSDAPIEVKQEAIKLLYNYYVQSTDVAMEQYLESQADLESGELQ